MKAFIITISCLVAVSIACVSTNIVIDKMTASPAISESENGSDNENNSNDSGNAVSDNTNGNASENGAANDVTAATDANGNTVAASTPAANVTPNKTNSNTGSNQNSQGNQNTGVNPLGYSKAQLVSYYNTALRKTYTQSSFKVEKSENINLQLGDILLDGKPATGIQGIVDKVVSANAKPKHGSKSFSSNPAVDAKDRYILPSNLSAQGVKSATASKSGSGYVVNFTLVPESCDFTQRPPYNNSCTFPLDFTEIDFGALGQITSAQFYYPGTTLRATIDSNGRVVQTHVVMPLKVSDAKGRGLGKDISINSISGTWTATNTMSF